MLNKRCQCVPDCVVTMFCLSCGKTDHSRPWSKKCSKRIQRYCKSCGVKGHLSPKAKACVNYKCTCCGYRHRIVGLQERLRLLEKLYHGGNFYGTPVFDPMSDRPVFSPIKELPKDEDEYRNEPNLVKTNPLDAPVTNDNSCLLENADSYLPQNLESCLYETDFPLDRCKSVLPNFEEAFREFINKSRIVV